MDYKNKYLKYKLKYLNEKKFIMEGGGKKAKKKDLKKDTKNMTECDMKKAAKEEQRKQQKKESKKLLKTQKAMNSTAPLDEGERSLMKIKLGKKLELKLAEIKQQQHYKKMKMSAKQIQLQKIKESIITMIQTSHEDPFAAIQHVKTHNASIEILDIEINTVSNTQEFTKLYKDKETQD